MAILDDDFQGYSIGDTVPFGSWILDTGAFVKSIVSGSAPTGMDRSLQLFGQVAVDPAVTGYQNSFSEFVAIRKLVAGGILSFANGPNGTGHTFTLLTIRVEQDGTLTCVGPGGLGDILANSGNAWFQFYVVNFLQIDVTFTDVNVLGVDYIHIQCDIELNGVQVISFDVTTTTPIAQLTNVTSEVNRFQLNTNGAFYSAFTLDTRQPAVTYPHPGSPSALVTQAVIEVDTLPDSAKPSSTRWSSRSTARFAPAGTFRRVKCVSS